MGKKSGSGGGLIVTLATTAGGFLARKGLAAGWRRATGKTAPTDPADRSVSIAEAVTFAAIAGVIGELVKLFVVRAATRPQVECADSAEAN
jgi:hypothetical protein